MQHPLTRFGYLDFTEELQNARRRCPDQQSQAVSATPINTKERLTIATAMFREPTSLHNEIAHMNFL